MLLIVNEMFPKGADNKSISDCSTMASFTKKG